jgi:hypothetical protein
MSMLNFVEAYQESNSSIKYRLIDSSHKDTVIRKRDYALSCQGRGQKKHLSDGGEYARRPAQIRLMQNIIYIPVKNVRECPLTGRFRHSKQIVNGLSDCESVFTSHED